MRLWGHHLRYDLRKNDASGQSWQAHTVETASASVSSLTASHAAHTIFPFALSNGVRGTRRLEQPLLAIINVVRPDTAHRRRIKIVSCLAGRCVGPREAAGIYSPPGWQAGLRQMPPAASSRPNASIITLAAKAPNCSLKPIWNRFQKPSNPHPPNWNSRQPAANIPSILRLQCLPVILDLQE